MSKPTSLKMPDIRRPDVMVVFIGQRYVPNRKDLPQVLKSTAARWADVSWPAGILSFNCYANTEEDTVLTYVQCDDRDAYQLFVASSGEPVRVGTVEYRLRVSVVPEGASGLPDCIVIATFDVDDAGRQDQVIDSLVDSLNESSDHPPPGMLSANFHASTDATRVLNYAEWTSDDAHLAFLESSTRVSTMRASGELPGVRPIGFKRYHLHCSISRLSTT